MERLLLFLLVFTGLDQIYDVRMFHNLQCFNFCIDNLLEKFVSIEKLAGVLVPNLILDHLHLTCRPDTDRSTEA